MVKILHTGDIHLDSAFAGLSLAKSENAREEQRRIFEKIIDYAKDNSFDMVLISGDLFDGKYITSRTREVVCKKFAELGCPVVISPGNHDPYPSVSLYNSEGLPKNVYVFSSEEMQVFDFDELGVSVCGYAFFTNRMEKSPLADFTPPSTDNALVLCAHAEINDPNSRFSPILPKEIDDCGFVYAALGHIHNDIELPSTRAVIRYSGIPMGRSFDELGHGGALAVTIENGICSAEKIIFSEHSFIEESLDVSGTESEAQIEEAILSFIKESGYGDETSLCLILRGAISIDCRINEDKLSSLKTSLRLLKIKDDTTPIPDKNSLLKDITLRGEIYRTLLPKMESDDPLVRKKAAEAFRIALCAIDGKNLTELLSLDDK